MDLLINALKGQFNSLNLILLSSLVSLVLYKMNRRKAGRILTVTAVGFFILFSTNYLPGYLIKHMESRYDPFDVASFPAKDGTLYIHVLGGGYTLDGRLSAQGQLSLVGLGRLAEAIRIYRMFDRSVLVVSGNIASGDKSLAFVAGQAAIDLGVDPTRLRLLETPSSTEAEADEFARKFGSTPDLIVVTDAVHMPRAIRFFSKNGIHAYPAPTNFIMKHDDNPFALRWVPSAENFLLMDRVLREFFGSVKAAF